MKAMSVHLSENRVKPINITKTNLNIQWRSGNKIKLLSMLSKCKSFWATHMNQSHISNIMIINRRLSLPKSKLSMCIRPPLAVCVSWFNLWSSMVMAYSPPWNTQCQLIATNSKRNVVYVKTGTVQSDTYLNVSVTLT